MTKYIDNHVYMYIYTRLMGITRMKASSQLEIRHYMDDVHDDNDCHDERRRRSGELPYTEESHLKIKGVLRRLNDSEWKSRYNLPQATVLDDTTPIMIDAKNVICHGIFTATSSNYSQWLRDEEHISNLNWEQQHEFDELANQFDRQRDREYTRWLETGTLGHWHASNIDLNAFASALRFFLTKLRAGGKRPVWVINDGASPVSKVKELEEREVKRSARVSSSFRKNGEETPEFMRKKEEWSRVLGVGLAPIAIDRVVMTIALETGCIPVACPGEADEVVAELSNCLKGVAMSEDGDVFNLSDRRIVKDDAMRCLLPTWAGGAKEEEALAFYKRKDVMSALKKEYQRRCRRKIKPVELSQVEWEHKLDELQKFGIALSSNEHHPPSKPHTREEILKNCLVVTSLREFDIYQGTKGYLRKLNCRLQGCDGMLLLPTGTRCDPPLSDGSDGCVPSVTRATAELRHAKLFIELKKLRKQKYEVKELDRSVRNSDLCEWKAVTEEDIGDALLNTVEHDDPEACLCVLGVSKELQSKDVYQVADTLAHVHNQGSKNQLAHATLQHEWVSVLLDAFPEYFSSSDRPPWVGYANAHQTLFNI